MNFFKQIFEKITLVTLDLIFENKISNKIRLNKALKYLYVVDLNDVKQLKNNNNYDVSKDKVFIMQDNIIIENYIKHFLEVMNSNFKSDDLTNLYNNIIWVKIKQNIFLKILSDEGHYKSKDNCISYVDIKKDSAIYHELFHLSSNPMNNNKPTTGGFFYEFDDETSIGIALDEGYTEYMVIKYLNNNYNSCYDVEIECSKIIEELIGKDLMENCYLKGNLFGVIKELSKYFELKEIERFLASTDFIHIYQDKYYLTNQETEILYSQYEEMLLFLLKIKCLKLKQNNMFGEEIIKDVLENLFINLNWDFEIDINTEKQIYKTISTVLGVNVDLNSFLEQYKSKDKIL